MKLLVKLHKVNPIRQGSHSICYLECHDFINCQSFQYAFFVLKNKQKALYLFLTMSVLKSKMPLSRYESPFIARSYRIHNVSQITCTLSYIVENYFGQVTSCIYTSRFSRLLIQANVYCSRPKYKYG